MHEFLPEPVYRFQPLERRFASLEKMPKHRAERAGAWSEWTAGKHG